MLSSHIATRPAPAALMRALPPIGPCASPDDLALLRQALGPAVAPASLQALAEAARLVRWPAGPLALDSPRRPEPAWWLLRSGVLALGSGTGEHFAERQLLAPGQWVDIAGALSAPGTWLDSAHCRTDVELLAVPVPALLAAAAADPALAQALLQRLAEQVRALSGQVDELAHADVPARLARWLLRHIEPPAHGGAQARLLLGEQKQAIARQLCTTSETLSRTLRRLSDQGVLQVQGYQLTVLDMGALQAVAQQRCGRGVG